MPDFLHRNHNIDQSELASTLDEVSLWSARFGTLLFQHLPLRPNLNILDLACGAGFPLFELAQVYGPSCQVTGVDVWRAGLERARAKQQVYQLPNVRIREADATRLPFQEQEFDLIISHLGINNFDDPVTALAECFRVAKPGARLVLTTNTIGHMREFYALFHDVLQELGKPEYLERLKRQEEHRGSQELFSKAIQGAGFQLLSVREDAFELRYADASAFFNHILTQVGFLDGWRSIVEQEDEERVFTLLASGLDLMQQEQGEIRLTVPMLYLESEKPA